MIWFVPLWDSSMLNLDLEVVGSNPVYSRAHHSEQWGSVRGIWVMTSACIWSICGICLFVLLPKMRIGVNTQQRCSRIQLWEEKQASQEEMPVLLVTITGRASLSRASRTCAQAFVFASALAFSWPSCWQKLCEGGWKNMEWSHKWTAVFR